MRVRLGGLVLALVALTGIFAEVVAGAAPVLAVGQSGVTLLPALLRAEEYRAMSREAIALRHRDDFAWWPLVRHGPERVSEAYAPASLAHPLGTDAEGHDVAARLVYGARTVLGLALLAIVAAASLGMLLGVMAGWVGGFFDELLARPVELVQAFPAVIVVALVRAAAPGLAAWSLVLGVTAVRWAEVARLARGEVIRVGSSELVEASRALGCSPARILRRHILPQALRPVIVSALFAIPSVVLLEVAVSFLGYGAASSWGTMLAQSMRGGVRAPLCAALLLAVTVGSAYLLADALGEALDVRVAARASWKNLGESRGFRK
jgi:peptide/nickel transport system permease protein